MTSTTTGWTYGAEHEWADHPLDREPPEGFGRDNRDHTMVNSNGIANDPSGRLYGFGGEFNTPPTNSVMAQVGCLTRLKKHYPEATINYRSNLHIHIRVPGLGQDLQLLKRVQKYIHVYMPTVWRQIEPLPRPVADDYPDPEELAGAQRRWRRRRVSHQTLLTPERLAKQLEATTVEEFYRLEVPQSRKGEPQWHFQPRLSVNLRQHRETDTVEFRHFPGTLDEDELSVAICWCRDFLHAALEGHACTALLRSFGYTTERFPQFMPYVHWMEQRYRATVHDGTNSKATIAKNIELILGGEWL